MHVCLCVGLSVLDGAGSVKRNSLQGNEEMVLNLLGKAYYLCKVDQIFDNELIDSRYIIINLVSNNLN